MAHKSKYMYLYQNDGNLSSDGIFQVVVGGLNRKVLHAEGEWLAPGSRIARSITVLGPVR